ncbi:hypothetical protein [Chryseobacterium chendengshani]|uniref:hypothetical protein n=1 Tax=Chryseobacterium sp. LJ756 TaxID=2864113 RepID=UPI001C63C579|nr:hypothetical protein [Chryseobacterium sp. LJ756]MBW7675691.1 hypothetical protein [Chryseobacterium sp. LJ756]
MVIFIASLPPAPIEEASFFVVAERSEDQRKKDTAKRGNELLEIMQTIKMKLLLRLLLYDNRHLYI